MVRKVFRPPCEENASSCGDVRIGYDWHQDFVAILFNLVRPKVYVELGLYQCELFNRAEPFVEEMYGVDINSEAHKYMINSPKANFFHGTKHCQKRNIPFVCFSACFIWM